MRVAPPVSCAASLKLDEFLHANHRSATEAFGAMNLDNSGENRAHDHLEVATDTYVDVGNPESRGADPGPSPKEAEPGGGQPAAHIHLPTRVCLFCHRVLPVSLSFRMDVVIAS